MKRIAAVAFAVVLAFSLPLIRATGQNAMEQTVSTQEALYPPSKILWNEVPSSLPPGAKLAVLEGNPNKEGPFVMRLRAPAGYHVPPHTHSKTERVTVISGTMLLAMGDKLDRSSAMNLPVGTYGFWPAGMKHTAWFDGETVIQVHGIGPWTITYINPADDPRNAKN